MDKFSNIMGKCFIHAVTFMIFNRMNTQVQFIRNHFAAEPVETEFYNFKFPLR
jgi:hypothetical protein